MLPDFNRLRTFYFVYTHQSITIAAEQLHLTQSAISQTLAKLESEIKCPLFTRVHKRLVPTPAANRLYNVLKPFIKTLANEIESIHLSQSQPRGEHSLGTPVEFGEKYLIPFCSSFQKTYPEVTFHIEVGHPNLLLPKLKSGELDFAFADIFSNRRQFDRELNIFDIQTVFTEKLILVCSNMYYETSMKKQQTLSALMNADFICYQKHAPAIRNWFKHHYNKSNVHVRSVITVESVKGVIIGINCNSGLGIVPSHLIEEELKCGQIIQIYPPRKALTNQISLVRLLDKKPGLAEKVFIEAFLEAVKGHSLAS